MAERRVLLPDGTPFEFWDDRSEYRRVYHVACMHPNASDANRGTVNRPFRTIGRAAQLLKPGAKVIVHGGVYRECVRPARGGEGPDRMIAYEAAPGEEVVVKGSDVWMPECRPSQGWRLRGAANGAPVWMADLPAEMFVGYNPFIADNMPAEYRTFIQDWTPAETYRFQLKRGMIFQDGRPLRQVFWCRELADADGAFWVEDPGLRVHFRLWGDADPAAAQLEVTVREQVFAPQEFHLGYVRVSGFRFEHAADGVPIPQRAMVSTSRGHHWIIEQNRMQWANSTALDVGGQTWHADRAADAGSHVIRRNHISDCGISGIQGCHGVDGTLVEDNVVERIGGLVPERLWECAGLKFHVCKGGLFRRNVFRHIRDACGVWLDVLNKNCRITNNVFADIETRLAAVYIECSHDLNLIDGNVFWDVRSTWRGEGGPGSYPTGGLGVFGDSGDHIVAAHNFFGRLPDNYAISFHLNQSARIVGGRVGLGRGHQALNNVLSNCPKRILFARADDVKSDGNLFDAANDAVSLCIRYPEPQALVNLSAWQSYYGLDRDSSQCRIEAAFDPEALELTWKADGPAPACQPVRAMHERAARRAPGPFRPDQWRRSTAGDTGRQAFPAR
jgi:hypothetical protein